MPGLADFFAHGIVAVLHLVKGEGLQLAGVDLSGVVQYLLVRHHVDNLAQHPQAVGLGLHLNDLALQRQGILLDHRRVHTGALHRVQAGAGKLVRHLVGTGNAQIIRLPQGVCAGHRQGKGLAGFQVGHRLVVGLQVQRDHVLGANAAPGHHHHIHRVVLVVGADHVGGHGEQVGLDAKIFRHKGYSSFPGMRRWGRRL